MGHPRSSWILVDATHLINPCHLGSIRRCDRTKWSEMTSSFRAMDTRLLPSGLWEFGAIHSASLNRLGGQQLDYLGAPLARGERAILCSRARIGRRKPVTECLPLAAGDPLAERCLHSAGVAPVKPECARRSPGWEEVEDVVHDEKLSAETQRVKVPPGKVRPHHPAASVAQRRATGGVKRTQRGRGPRD